MLAGLQPIDVVALAVSAVIGVRLVVIVCSLLGSPARDRMMGHWSQLRWRHALPVPFVLAAVAGTAGALWLIPPLRIGWWSLIGGQGSAVFGASDTSMSTWWGRLIPLVFIALIAAALPMLAESEERMFRLGAEHWSWGKRVNKTLQFGLIHLIVGVPIAVALALAVGGAYFLWRYLWMWNHSFNRVRSLDESTRAHLAYNAIVLGFAAVSFIAW
jgi:hypothetical protein